jgi:hypothetical protein
LRAVGANGGKLDGMVELESGSNSALQTGFRLTVFASISLRREDPAEWPTVDLDVSSTPRAGRSTSPPARRADDSSSWGRPGGRRDLDLLGVNIVGKPWSSSTRSPANA